MLRCQYCGAFYSEPVFPHHLKRCRKEAEQKKALEQTKKQEAAKELENKKMREYNNEQAKKKKAIKDNMKKEVKQISADDLEDMNLEQLREIAETLDIEKASKYNSKQLINAIKKVYEE